MFTDRMTNVGNTERFATFLCVVVILVGAIFGLVIGFASLQP